MDRELNQKLNKDFPLLFSDTGKSMKESLMCFGCECRDGWEGIIRQACEELEPLVKQWIEQYPEQADAHARFIQIKEKFGTLCLYMTGIETDEMFEITRKYEELSAITCDRCGTQGGSVKSRGGGWIYTSCLNCSDTDDVDGLDYVEEVVEDKKKDEPKE